MITYLKDHVQSWEVIAEDLRETRGYTKIDMGKVKKLVVSVDGSIALYSGKKVMHIPAFRIIRILVEVK
jgi:hypothetical protein